MESARRWSGYVCPDCRFVFRVPRDHDGRGIVCPSCRRMLKIPAAGDVTPPLVISLRRVASEAPPGGSGEGMVQKRRKRRRKQGEGEALSWEQESGHRGVRHRDRRQMRLMLIAGAGLLALILTVTIVAMQSSKPTASVVEKKPVQPVVPEPVKAMELAEAVFLAQAEPLASKFLSARTVSEMLPLVRNPAVTGPRMQAFYPDGAIPAPGLGAFNTSKSPARYKQSWMVTLTTRDHDERAIAFIETPEGLKIDWESWAGWSDIPWPEFIARRPADRHVFRLTLSVSDYYNFAFSDETKWQAYRLESPDREHAIFGYAEKGSLVERRLLPGPDRKLLTVMVALKYPADPPSANQVEIVEFIADGWVETHPVPP